MEQKTAAVLKIKPQFVSCKKCKATGHWVVAENLPADADDGGLAYCEICGNRSEPGEFIHILSDDRK